jgi:hypothetical protein
MEKAYLKVKTHRYEVTVGLIYRVLNHFNVISIVLRSLLQSIAASSDRYNAIIRDK